MTNPPLIGRAFGWRAPLLPIFLLYAVSFFGFALINAPPGDYPLYMVQWEHVLEGENPWADHGIAQNAYGPLHNAFALAHYLSPLLPKAIFALSSIFSSFLLLRRIADDGHITIGWRSIFLALAFPLHPLIVFSSFHMGFNDVVCMALIIIAFSLKESERQTLAGAAVGLAALMKFYPIFFAPFLMIGANRVIQLRAGVAAGLVFIAGMAIGYAIWGDAVFTPFQFAAGRGAKLLSIYRAIEAFPQLVGGEEIVRFLLDTNKYAVLGAAAGIFLLLFSIGARWNIAAVIGVLTILTAFKVGHQQFYMPWLAAYAWLIANPKSRDDLVVAKRLAPAALWLGIFACIYEAASHMQYADEQVLDDYISIPSFIIATLSIVAAIRAIWRKPVLFPFKIAW